jgi:enterochelin esterase-like enzyme
MRLLPPYGETWVDADLHNFYLSSLTVYGRLVISDGVHFQQAMLATQLNELVNDGQLQPKCVVRLNEYICNTVHGRRYASECQIQH